MLSLPVLTFLTSTLTYSALSAVLAFAWGTVLATAVTRRVQPAVPTLTWWKAAIFAAVGAGGLSALVQNPTAAIVFAIIVPLLVVASYVDALTKRIPNLYNGCAFLAVLAMTVGVGIAVHPMAAVIAGVASAAVLVAFGALSLLSGGKFGMGDVKLGGVLAMAMTVIDVVLIPTPLLHTALGLTLLALHLLVWTTLSFLFGGVYGMTLLVRKRNAAFPFGPFLAAGWVFAAAAAPAFVSLISPYA